MARQRRGPDLGGTLGTLLRTTLAQANNLRDVLERGAREGRSRAQGVLANRRRSEALADLGEIVLDLIRRGEIDIDELPEARELVAHLDELDADVDPEPEAPRPIRKRFDARSDRARDRHHDDDDGTASAASWSPPTRTKSANAPRVWRPPVDAAPPPAVPPPPKKTGGIRFDDDDDSDLADYMHPDDVPKKPDP